MGRSAEIRTVTQSAVHQIPALGRGTGVTITRIPQGTVASSVVVFKFAELLPVVLPVGTFWKCKKPATRSSDGLF
jgi:hypothetical protein